MRKKFYIFILGCVYGLFGCQTLPPAVETPKIPPVPGVYHKMERGQTLWRISKIYSVDLEELVKINHITDTTNIETGRTLFIPKRTQQNEIMPQTGQINSEEFIWPIKGKVIAGFGQIVDNIVNKGLDIAPAYDSNVVASRAGRIVFYHPQFCGYGKTVIIDHGDGFFTVYAGNSEVLVKIGDTVKKNSIIAKAENSQKQKNTFLHFEIRKGSTPQNPYFYLP